MASQDSVMTESKHWVPVQAESTGEERTLSELGSTMETHLLWRLAQGHTWIWKLMSGSFTTQYLFDGHEIPFLYAIKLGSSEWAMAF